MKKLFNIILIVIALIFSTLDVKAQEVTADYVRNQVANMVKENLAAQGLLDVDVKIINLPFQKLDLPDGSLNLKLSGNNLLSYSKRCIKTLQIFVNGKFEYSLGVPVEINASKMALVATKQINRDQSINVTNVVLQKVEVSSNLAYLLDPSSLKAEMLATKGYRQGEFIDKRFVKARADVERNEMVTVLFKMGGAVAVSVSGKALSDGSLGDTVAVQNNENKRVYYGRVISKNQVQINI